jgi:hypothetical protein
MNFLVDFGGRLATRRLGREPKLGRGLRTASQEWNSRVREGRIAFTTAIGILVRSREKGLLTGSEALANLMTLAKHGRYEESILEDARRKLGRAT